MPDVSSDVFSLSRSLLFFFFFSSRRRHTRCSRDWSSDVCSSDLVCFTCDVCCRFPERDSLLRPYFTREEIQAAIARGISPDAFPDHTGSKVAVVLHGEGYRCPAFQAETGRCGIYEDRPLDCRLYPVAVMWGREHADVVMGWDSKCPFIRDNLESAESRAYVERTAALLESEDTVRIFLANPQLVGAYQDDVIVLRRLNRLTQGLRAASPRASR